jgi:FdhE protein
MADVFEKRIRRAGQLEKEWEFAASVLGFYAPLAQVQRELLALQNAPASDETTRAQRKLLARLLEIVRDRGPQVLAERATAMTAEDLYLIEIEQERDPVDEFFLRIVEQPKYVSTVRLEGLGPSQRPGACPFCELPPVVSVLREDKQADTVRRTLVCPRCCNEWDFPRVLCPNCKEEKPEKLPRYTAQEIPWMRVEACDSCKKYLKSVDLTLNWEAEPIVDELASTPLDVIAREHGYTKIAPNLAGI